MMLRLKSFFGFMNYEYKVMARAVFLNIVDMFLGKTIQ